VSILAHRPLLWIDLRQNVVAGARLALFMRVRPLDFRVSAPDYAMLVLTSLACWAAGGLARVGAPGAVDVHALTVALAQIPVVLLACLALAWIFRSPQLLLAFAVLLTATDPLFEVVSVAAHYLGALDVPDSYASIVNWAFIAWGVATIARTQWVLSGWRGLRSLTAAVVLAALAACFLWVLPRSELWAEPPEPPPATSAITREDVFHFQGQILDAQLDDLAAERPGVEDLYFVGVAAYGLQDTFAKELTLVRQLMEERFDTAGRSIALINHPATLQSIPIATTTNLRTVLEYLGENINVDEDVVMLHLTTHGGENHELAFELPPLELQALTPTALARMLADSGIKWKIIVISACYSGGFIEPLRDDNSLIITATDARNSSFGCDYESDITWFSKAFYDQGLRRTYSFADAFKQAKEAVAAWERADGFEPSNPQIFLGAAMKAKLASIERRIAAPRVAPHLTASVNAGR